MLRSAAPTAPGSTAAVGVPDRVPDRRRSHRAARRAILEHTYEYAPPRPAPAAAGTPFPTRADPRPRSRPLPGSDTHTLSRDRHAERDAGLDAHRPRAGSAPTSSRRSRSTATTDPTLVYTDTPPRMDAAQLATLPPARHAPPAPTESPPSDVASPRLLHRLSRRFRPSPPQEPSSPAAAERERTPRSRHSSLRSASSAPSDDRPDFSGRERLSAQRRPPVSESRDLPRPREEPPLNRTEPSQTRHREPPRALEAKPLVPAQKQVSHPAREAEKNDRYQQRPGRRPRPLSRVSAPAPAPARKKAQVPLDDWVPDVVRAQRGAPARPRPKTARSSQPASREPEPPRRRVSRGGCEDEIVSPAHSHGPRKGLQDKLNHLGPEARTFSPPVSSTTPAVPQGLPAPAPLAAMSPATQISPSPEEDDPSWRRASLPSQSSLHAPSSKAPIPDSDAVSVNSTIINEIPGAFALPRSGRRGMAYAPSPSLSDTPPAQEVRRGTPSSQLESGTRTPRTSDQQRSIPGGLWVAESSSASDDPSASGEEGWETPVPSEAALDHVFSSPPPTSLGPTATPTQARAWPPQPESAESVPRPHEQVSAPSNLLLVNTNHSGLDTRALIGSPVDSGVVGTPLASLEEGSITPNVLGTNRLIISPPKEESDESEKSEESSEIIHAAEHAVQPVAEAGMSKESLASITSFVSAAASDEDDAEPETTLRASSIYSQQSGTEPEVPASPHGAVVAPDGAQADGALYPSRPTQLLRSWHTDHSSSPTLSSESEHSESASCSESDSGSGSDSDDEPPRGMMYRAPSGMLVEVLTPHEEEEEEQTDDGDYEHYRPWERPTSPLQSWEPQINDFTPAGDFTPIDDFTPVDHGARELPADGSHIATEPDFGEPDFGEPGTEEDLAAFLPTGLSDEAAAAALAAMQATREMMSQMEGRPGVYMGELPDEGPSEGRHEDEAPPMAGGSELPNFERSLLATDSSRNEVRDDVLDESQARQGASSPIPISSEKSIPSGTSPIDKQHEVHAQENVVHAQENVVHAQENVVHAQGDEAPLQDDEARSHEEEVRFHGEGARAQEEEARFLEDEVRPQEEETRLQEEEVHSHVEEAQSLEDEARSLEVEAHVQEVEKHAQADEPQETGEAELPLRLLPSSSPRLPSFVAQSQSSPSSNLTGTVSFPPTTSIVATISARSRGKTTPHLSTPPVGGTVEPPLTEPHTPATLDSPDPSRVKPLALARAPAPHPPTPPILLDFTPMETDIEGDADDEEEEVAPKLSNTPHSRSERQSFWSNWGGENALAYARARELPAPESVSEGNLSLPKEAAVSQGDTLAVGEEDGVKADKLEPSAPLVFEASSSLEAEPGLRDGPKPEESTVPQLSSDLPGAISSSMESERGETFGTWAANRNGVDRSREPRRRESEMTQPSATNLPRMDAFLTHSALSARAAYTTIPPDGVASKSVSESTEEYDSEYDTESESDESDGTGHVGAGTRNGASSERDEGSSDGDIANGVSEAMPTGSVRASDSSEAEDEGVAYPAPIAPCKTRAQQLLAGKTSHSASMSSDEPTPRIRSVLGGSKGSSSAAAAASPLIPPVNAQSNASRAEKIFPVGERLHGLSDSEAHNSDRAVGHHRLQDLRDSKSDESVSLEEDEDESSSRIGAEDDSRSLRSTSGDGGTGGDTGSSPIAPRRGLIPPPITTAVSPSIVSDSESSLVEGQEECPLSSPNLRDADAMYASIRSTRNARWSLPSSISTRENAQAALDDAFARFDPSRASGRAKELSRSLPSEAHPAATDPETIVRRSPPSKAPVPPTSNSHFTPRALGSRPSPGRVPVPPASVRPLAPSGPRVSRGPPPVHIPERVFVPRTTQAHLHMKLLLDLQRSTPSHPKPHPTAEEAAPKLWAAANGTYPMAGWGGGKHGWGQGFNPVDLMQRLEPVMRAQMQGLPLSHAALRREQQKPVAVQPSMGAPPHQPRPIAGGQSYVPPMPPTHQGAPLPRPQGIVGAILPPGARAVRSPIIPAVAQSELRRRHSTGARRAPRAVSVRVYIVTKHRYLNLDIYPDAISARELVADAMAKASVHPEFDDPTPGGWCLFDVSADLGLERPLREYESLGQVLRCRNNPASDYLFLRRTESSSLLSARSMPVVAPALAGWVHMRDKRNKWTKRWLELRDHALFHAKNMTGKDEVMVGELKEWDIELIHNPLAHTIKLPKACGFAVRRQAPRPPGPDDERSLAVFSLTDPAAHRDWVRSIILARTYVLKQEQPRLFCQIVGRR